MSNLKERTQARSKKRESVKAVKKTQKSQGTRKVVFEKTKDLEHYIVPELMQEIEQYISDPEIQERIKSAPDYVSAVCFLPEFMTSGMIDNEADSTSLFLQFFEPRQWIAMQEAIVINPHYYLIVNNPLTKKAKK